MPRWISLGIPLACLCPPPDDHPFTPTRPFSWTGSYSGEFGDQEAFPTTTAIRGSTQDSSTATTSFGEMEMHSTSFSQAPGLQTYSAVHLPDSTPNDYSSPDPPSTHDEAAHQLETTVAFTPPSSRVSSHRNPKKYWCHSCPSGFVQEQGLNRHIKDTHSQRNSCPYCRDFEWSKGRLYLFKRHLRKIHPGAPLPRTKTQRQDEAPGSPWNCRSSLTLVPSLMRIGYTRRVHVVC